MVLLLGLNSETRAGRQRRVGLCFFLWREEGAANRSREISPYKREPMSAKGSEDDASDSFITPIPLDETWVMSWSLAGWSFGYI